MFLYFFSLKKSANEGKIYLADLLLFGSEINFGPKNH